MTIRLDRKTEDAPSNLQFRVLVLLACSLVPLLWSLRTKNTLSILNQSHLPRFDIRATTGAVPENTTTELIVNDTSNATNGTIPNFKKYDGVVIVTKIHGPRQEALLHQCLCLLHHAYNKFILYDIVVFYAEPLTPESEELTRQLVAPAKVTFAMDNKGFQEEVAALSPERRANFLKACKVDSPEGLHWFSECPGRIAYNWQAEFRSWHIWRQPSLKDYKYMLWLDSDAFSTEIWQQDPMKTMIENDLTILFDNFPMGRVGNKEAHRRIFEAFGKDLCGMSLQDGHFVSNVVDQPSTCDGTAILDIHGFFHVTKLDFFRSDLLENWGRVWIGDGFLQREYDDQFAVTAPTALLAPEKSWDMRSNGIQLNVYHNGRLDGKERAGGYLKYFDTVVKHQLPDATVCPIKAANRR